MMIGLRKAHVRNLESQRGSSLEKRWHVRGLYLMFGPTVRLEMLKVVVLEEKPVYVRVYKVQRRVTV